MIDETTSISVIIPTWNRWPRVGEAVASVLRQSLPPLEVLVVDDGSDDGTADALTAELQGDDWSDADRERCRILRQGQRGVSAARNVGIEASRGAWLAFLDSDDLWQTDKLERQMAALATAEAAGEPHPTGHFDICHCDEIWIRNGRRVNPRRRHAKEGGWIYRQCLPLCAISPSAVMIRRHVFERFGGFDESLPACEDYDLWLRLCAELPVLYLDAPLVIKHGGHDDQLSRRTPALDRYRIQALSKSLANPAVQGEDRRQTLATLCAKIEVYGAGARKRGRLEEAEALDALKDRWLKEEASRAHDDR